MKNYELTYLISSDVFGEELKNLSEKIKSFVQEEEGVIKKTIEPSKTKLGYSIKEKGEAFLVTINFSLSPEKIANLEKKLKAENQILRYMILNKDLPEKILRPKRTRPELKTKESEKVELKEIDKKIEEILKE
ncbi:30S ribosomal protein S6 [Patescibacteria group bacterium]|nr:30S ribosomal protein S6 [Patescibacteria group bacterium]